MRRLEADLTILVLVLKLYLPDSCTAQPSSSSDRASIDETTRLRHEVISSIDRRFRPVDDQRQPIVVYVSFNLLSLLSIDEVKQKVEMNVWFNFSWMDEIRTWDPGDYSGITLMHPDPQDVWRPRVFVSNSVQERDVFGDGYMPFTLYNTGLTRWYPGAIFYTSCTLHLRYFPFDDQTCSLSIYTNDFVEELILNSTSPVVILTDYTPSGEWKLMSTQVLSETVKFGQERNTRVAMTLNLKRKPESFVMNVLIPVMVLSLLSFMVFVLPRESGERASFSITVLLSMALFLSIVSEKLPKQPESLPLVITYLFSLFLLSGISVIVTVCVLARTPPVIITNTGQSSDDANPSQQRDQGDVLSSEPVRSQPGHAHSKQAASQAFGVNGQSQNANGKKTRCVTRLGEMLENSDVRGWAPSSRKVSEVRPLYGGYEGSVVFPVGSSQAQTRGSKWRSAMLTWKTTRLVKTVTRSVDAMMFLIFLMAWLVITFYFLLVFLT